MSAMTLNVGLPDTHGARRLVEFGVPSADGAGSGWFQVEAGPESESLEKEPDDSVAEATSVQFPGVLNGRFDRLGDQDYFKFKGQKGQRLHCVACSRELGSASDVYMSLHKADGSNVAEARQERRRLGGDKCPKLIERSCSASVTDAGRRSSSGSPQTW